MPNTCWGKPICRGKKLFYRNGGLYEKICCFFINDFLSCPIYSQLPLTTKVEPFSNNEMTFYPPDKLNTANTPLSGGEAGSLSYYAPWGDVVMFYAPCTPNNSLYELGDVVSGKENIEKLAGEITVSVYE